jgi:CHAD domain-containing protein
MAFAFEREEPMTAAIPRLMNEQLVRVREQLSDPHSPLEERIHDARKRFKESRAVVRLIRGPLGAHFAVENAWYRDAGRDLSAARDVDAVLEALSQLELPRGIRSRARKVLRSRPHPHDLDGRIANVLDQVVIAQARVTLWPAIDDDFESIAPGLLRTYRQGRALRGARTPHELHEWRKVVKTQWYHAQLLREIFPAMMKAQIALLSDLSRALGDHHDLFELRHIVSQSPREFGRPSSAIAILDAIDARQRELEAQAATLGAGMYAERPRAWLARMWNYWTAWRK